MNSHDNAHYDWMRNLYSRAKSTREVQAVTEQILKLMDERDDKGNYLYDPAMFDPIGVKAAMESADYDHGTRLLETSVGSQEFPYAVSGFIAKKILRSYDDYARNEVMIGDQLFEQDPSKKKGDKILRMNSKSLLQPTPWGMPAPLQELGESYVTCTWVRFVRAVDLTEDLVLHEQTGDVYRYAMELGPQAQETLERARIDSVTDQTTGHLAQYKGQAGYYVYQPSGTNTELYHASLPTGATNGNTLTNALADYTDVDAARLRIAGFYDDDPERVEDSDASAGKRIRVTRGMKLLVPLALEGTAWKIFKSPLVNSDANNAVNPAGPGGFLNMPYIVSQDLDAQSATTWYFGDFKRQFKERQGIPFRVLTANRASQAEFMSKGVYARAVAEFYIAHYATSNRYVVRCTA